MKSLIAAALAAISFNAMAVGGVASGVNGTVHVLHTRANSDGTGIIEFDTLLSTGPACGATHGWGQALATANTDQGRALLGLAVAARLSGAAVTDAYGTGVCTLYPNLIEDAANLRF